MTQQSVSEGKPCEVASLHSDADHYLPIDDLLKEVMLGDIIEFERGDYTDYALYLGDEKVMTFEVRNRRAIEATIQERSLKEVCNTNEARVRGHEDVAQSLFNLLPKPAESIVKKARTYIGNVVPFEFDFRNSEYYCTLWRYGIGFSTQAAQQAWLSDGSSAGNCTADNTRSNLFGPDGYAKYKQLSMTERGEHSTDQY